MRCVGKGAFGKVRIVEKRDTKKLYALKYINKLQCIRMRAIQNIFRERAILEELSHPLIVNLRFAFQDDENMFMVIDLMMGGDLRYHLDRMGGFSEDAVRLIAAETAAAIGYLHSKKIVHRDLKPDNVLLDEHGHAHLTDFNIAVSYEDRRVLKSHSGTHAYMAPEIFADQGYLWQIDLWSLGILIYELLYGKRPFRGNNNDAVTLSIRNDELVFPNNNMCNKQPVLLSAEANHFIRGLLERDPKRRLGCGPREFGEVYDHPWFEGFDWRAVENKMMKPEFVPDSDRPNFDATFDLEELLLEENPLTYRPRKKKPAKPPAPGADGGVLSAREAGNGGGSGGDSKPGLLGKGARSASAKPSVNKEMTAKEKIAADLQFIDDYFRSFDATIYDKYPGAIDSSSNVGDPPEWVIEAGKRPSAASAAAAAARYYGRNTNTTDHSAQNSVNNASSQPSAGAHLKREPSPPVANAILPVEPTYQPQHHHHFNPHPASSYPTLAHPSAASLQKNAALAALSADSLLFGGGGAPTQTRGRRVSSPANPNFGPNGVGTGTPPAQPPPPQHVPTGAMRYNSVPPPGSAGGSPNASAVIGPSSAGGSPSGSP
ncbi:hypothetical protein HK101_004338, partial [Irineochytrium annulatum]